MTHAPPYSSVPQAAAMHTESEPITNIFKSRLIIFESRRLILR